MEKRSSKRIKSQHKDPQEPIAPVVEESKEQAVIIKFRDADGVELNQEIQVDSNYSKGDLNKLINSLMRNEEPQLFQFFYEEHEVRSSLQDLMEKQGLGSKQELLLPLTYKPEAMFRIRPVTRASSTLEGHTEAVLAVAFSADGSKLASGAGDRTVRLWDLQTETPLATCSDAHKHWVLFVAFSPDSKVLASGGMDANIFLWDADDGKKLGPPLKGHKGFITSISWEPYQSIKDPKKKRMASSSKDQTVRIWDTGSFSCLIILSSHTASVTKVLWGGEGRIYSGSQDRTIKVWNAATRQVEADLKGHSHWVNTLALSSDYVLRTGWYSPDARQPTELDPFEDFSSLKKVAVDRYSKIRDVEGERLVSGSDDFTMIMWQPKKGSKPVARLTGHQALINQVQFSPDALYFVSASFDKSIKLWDGKNGTFLATMRGHVQSVYQVAWSADSRLLVSASKDSTLKVWDMQKRKLMFDLPGHADEVYAVDWSPDGEKVASGSKDHRIRIWKN